MFRGANAILVLAPFEKRVLCLNAFSLVFRFRFAFQLQREKKRQLSPETGGSEASVVDGDAEQSLETHEEVSEMKKRKRSEVISKGDDRRKGAGRDTALGRGDVEADDIVAGEEGPESKKRGRKKKTKVCVGTALLMWVSVCRESVIRKHINVRVWVTIKACVLLILGM